jgi:uncharacterized membrane protein (UPF0182 family)
LGQRAGFNDHDVAKFGALLLSRLYLCDFCILSVMLLFPAQTVTLQSLLAMHMQTVQADASFLWCKVASKSYTRLKLQYSQPKGNIIQSAVEPDARYFLFCIPFY